MCKEPSSSSLSSQTVINHCDLIMYRYHMYTKYPVALSLVEEYNHVRSPNL